MEKRAITDAMRKKMKELEEQVKLMSKHPLSWEEALRRIKISSGENWNNGNSKKSE